MKKEILEITKKFHNTYEKLASEYTYETREDTKVFDINSNNGKLMYATVNEIVSPILKENEQLKNNWNKLKERITDGSKAYRNRCYDLVCDIEEVPKEQWNDVISYLAFGVMQELIKYIEQGSDSNE